MKVFLLPAICCVLLRSAASCSSHRNRYSPDNLLAREHLSNHPDVKQHLTDMWNKLLLQYYDKSHTGTLSKSEYVSFHYALCRAVMQDGITDEVRRCGSVQCVSD